MNTIKYAITAVAFTAFSSAAFAVQPVTPLQAESMSRIGVVSADGATTLDGLETRLVNKAEAAGAAGYRIISAAGNNKMAGSAVIYK